MAREMKNIPHRGDAVPRPPVPPGRDFGQGRQSGIGRRMRAYVVG